MATRKKKTSSKRKPASNGKGSAVRAGTVVDFHYLKGPEFRTIHVDGALGGLTTSGFLHMAVFAERAAIPVRVVHSINADGTLGDEIAGQRESKAGVVRQLEIDLFMNEATARNIRDWLNDKIDEFERRNLEIKSRTKGKVK